MATPAPSQVYQLQAGTSADLAEVMEGAMRKAIEPLREAYQAHEWEWNVAVQEAAARIEKEARGVLERIEGE